MPSLPERLVALRGTLDTAEEEKLLDILINIALEHEEGDTWHALEVGEVFVPLTQAQVASIKAEPGVPQIIVKGDPPTQATYFHPVTSNGSKRNGQPLQ